MSTIITFDFGNGTMKIEIPEDCLKLLTTIDLLSNLQPIQDAREIQKDAFLSSVYGWESALWWAFQRRAALRLVNFPLNKTEESKAAKPFGYFLYSMFCLAKAVLDVIDTLYQLDYLEKTFRIYKDADEWFKYLCLEQELSELFCAVFPELIFVAYVLPDDQQFNYNKGQRSVLGYLQALPNRDTKERKMREELKMLKQKENPYPLDSGDLYRLIEFSTLIAQIKIQGKKDDLASVIRIFRKAWKNYIDDYARLLSNLHRGVGGKMRHIKGDKIYETVSGNKVEVIRAAK
ncbi:hypothetical protein H6F98_12025 [Microcoleus sp. FACHB-SPT15]|uniref:hypothetical protein n=1 Tax=Microcoleus sp. FACHB-SPT15 TaxID=2692830 RepID=UPI001780ABCF|nr:hypothetical protein [Microcoleus sp. FACHB-SPT15]MBD1806175.1 hypothetical protein [Microcoleus sp. FACHB-SPT15]